MALRGLRPVAEIEFADFIHPAFDQIVSEAARMRYRTNGAAGVPMVIRAPCGGGIHGALYHSQSIEVFYAHVPGLKVVMPATPADAAGMLRTAIADPDPVLFLEHKKCYRLVSGEVPDGRYTTPIGTASIAREGTGPLSVISYGYDLHRCLEAAGRLEADEGIRAEVVDVRTLAPLDTETILASVGRTSQRARGLRGQPHLRRRAPRSWPRSPSERCSTSTRPWSGSGGPTSPRCPTPQRSSTSTWSRSQTTSTGRCATWQPSEGTVSGPSRAARYR